MSQENVAIVHSAFEAFNTGGIEAMLPFLAPDVVYYPPPAPRWIEDAEYRGHAAIRKLSAMWTDNFDNFANEVQEARDTGERVLVLYEQVGRIKGSDRVVRQQVGAVFSDFRDGRIGKGRFFFTHEEALEAAGLSE